MAHTRSRIVLATAAAVTVLVASGSTAIATPPPTDPNLPPAVVDPGESLYFYGGFEDVPKLGEEPVRGTNCGAGGQIGDVIPDGLWAGYVEALEFDAAGAGTVGIDLLCIFFGDSARAVAAEGTANILSHDPDYLIVNNNERVRTLPTAPSLVLRESVVSGDNSCVEASPGSFVEPGPRPDTQAWIRVAGGAVTWVLWGCGPFGAAPAELPPAFPISSLPEGQGLWPYGEYWNVPQLGTEPVRGSGCGASGQLGDTIPDGLWAGYVAYDQGGDVFWVDVLCIYAGATADAIRAEGTANIVSDEPDYLIVNNNERRRQVANNLHFTLSSVLLFDGRCLTGSGLGVLTPDDLRAMTNGQLYGDGNTVPLLYPNLQAWIRIHEGAVTWIAWGCDVPGSGVGG